MGNSVKELVNAFNLNNYFSGKINTSFVVKDKKIIGLFTHDTDVTKYLQRIREEIVKRHYGTEVAGKFYNLSYFPFFPGRSYNKRHVNKGLTVVEFADSTNDRVIRNLKIHFAKEVERAVKLKVIAYLQKEVGITEEEAYKWIKEAVRLGAMGRSSPYLYCIAFSDEYFKREGYEDSLETLELLKELYIEEFNSRLREYGLRSSDFYEFKGNILYIKNINDRTVRSVTEYVKGRVALDLRTPGTLESKVQNCKDVLSDLIFKSTGKLVYGYDYEVFVDKKKIERGNKYALIPLVEVYDKNYGGGRLDPLNKEDAKEFNKKFGEVLRDISGKTEDRYGQIANSKGPVYAFSNKGIAQLLPIIMQSPIAYNKEFGRFEFAVNLEEFRNRQRSFSPNPGSDGEDLPSSSLSGIDSPRQGTTLSSPLLLRSVEAKKKVLWNFIHYLPLEKNEKSRAEIHSFLSSDEGDEKLYSILSSFCDRDGLYPELHLSCKQRNKMEEKWWSLLHQFEESLSASSEELAGLTLGGPRCRNSVASKDSKDSAYYTGSPTSRRSSFGSVKSSNEDDFSRNSLQYASSISQSSAESSISSNASVGTVIGVEHDPGLPNRDIDNEKESSAKLSQMELESSQRGKGKELKRCPRLESEEGGLQNSGYQLPTQLSFTKVSGSQSQQSVGAVYNVQARTNTQPQQMNPSLQQGTHENKWSQSGHSSRTSAWSQPMNPWSLLALSGYIPGFLLPTQVDSRDKPLTEKEKELIKALLYAFNLNNYILECPHTNFIVENGKIASLINDDVNVKEYLQELRDCTIKEYCGTEEEAKKEGYDLNEFPFKFLSHCEKNQETTVVANISRGALLNLKKLFIRHEQGVEIEDIDIKTVEKAVESQKNIWVDSQVRGGYCGSQAAIESCYPDESVLKDIPIIKGEDGYYLDRIYGTLEVESFMEKQLHAQDTSKAEKMKPEDNKDSGYSSGFTTDAEKGEKSPKCRSQSPVGRGSPEKSLRRDSSTLDAANFTQQPDISKSDRFSDKSSREGFPDTGGGINMQYTGARKKITGESDICSANPWAVVPGTAFVLDSVSHVKSNIDKLGEDFSGAIKVTEEEKLGSSKLEPRHQWLDRERHRRSTKQATEEESISN